MRAASSVLLPRLGASRYSHNENSNRTVLREDSRQVRLLYDVKTVMKITYDSGDWI